jgi:ribosomal protein S18 acetylase RimI-like enzyme
MSKFTARQATISDISFIAKLFDDYRVFYEKESDLSGAELFLTDRFNYKESIIFVVENQTDGIVGFTQLYPLFSSTRMKRLWLLNDLYVNQDFRGLGLSKMLIDASKEHCRATYACALTLETAKNNDIGNKLYPSTGFEKDEAHNFYEWEVK